MSEKDNHLERAVELLVYAPIGLAMFAKDTVPTFLKMFVARGETEVTQRRKTAETQAGQYKTIGQMAVKYGGPEVRRQAEAAAGTVRKRAEDTIAAVASAATTPAPPVNPTSPATPIRPANPPANPSASAAQHAPLRSTSPSSKPSKPATSKPTALKSALKSASKTAPKTVAKSVAKSGASNGSRAEASASEPAPFSSSASPGESAGKSPLAPGPAPAEAALAIPDYDLLSAPQVIDRLVGLARPDLLAVQAYEAAHRARTTILGKIAQLSA